MRISGLASGMDTETIIYDLMKANRIPLNKVTQKKAYMEYQLDDYRTINRQLNDFSIMSWESLLSPASSAFRKKTVEISSPDAVAIKSKDSSPDFSGTLKVDQLATNATMQSAEIAGAQGKATTQTLADLGITGNSITITTKNDKGENVEKTFTAESTDTLKSLLDKINRDSGVNAFFDTGTGQIALSAKNSGGGEAIKVEGDLAIGLGFIDGQTASGLDAKFSLNGLEMTRASNTFEVNGLEFTLKETTSNPITFNSTSDTESIFDAVVNYVDEYNKLIEGLNSKIREQKYRDFQPLSAEEKADMKENEIKLWEEKAMSGTLRNDPTISNMLTKMRTALMGTAGTGEGKGTLSEIGITTSKAYMDHGKLVIDKDALRAAIEEDPSKVEKLFTNNPSGGTEAEKGFAVRLRTLAQESQKVITNKAGKAGDSNETFTLGRSLKDMIKQIEQFERRMEMVETRLWKQFSAMEQAINRANAQSAQLMNALGGM